MGPIVLYLLAKNQEDPQSRGGEKDKKGKKKHLFENLILYNLGSSLFQKNYLTQTINPIDLYTHAKNKEDPQKVVE